MSDRWLLVLVGVSGSIDGVSFLEFGEVFTANMTGNTVLLGLAVGQAHWAAALRSMVALAGFCAGLACGAAVSPSGATVPRALGCELAAVTALLIGWSLGLPKPWLIAAAASAMGIQSAAVARVDTAGTATTFITGTLTNLILRATDLAAARHAPPVRSREIALPATILPTYGVAAALMALALPPLAKWTLLFPLFAVAAGTVATRRLSPSRSSARRR